MLDLTVLIPYQKGSRKDWLDEAIASIPPGIKYLLLENDGELAEALNQGLKAATTEYVMRLDADDCLDEESVQLLMDACWDVDVAYPDLFLVDEDLKYMGTHEPGDFCPNRLTVWNYIPGAGPVMRREAVLAIGGYRHMESLEDWDLWVRMARNGATFKHHPEAKYYYRQVAGGRNTLDPVRANEIKQDIVGDEPKMVATFYAQETVATTYWRCVLPSRFLPAQTVLHRPTVQINDEKISFRDHRGTAIWQFPGHHYERFMMAAMQELGIPCLVETDDTYLMAAQYGRNHWIKGVPPRGQENTSPSLAIHRKVVGWCDGVIVTTEHLAKQYRKATEAPVFVCPNQVDPADWVPGELPDWYDPNKTYVGLAASGSHRGDLKLVQRALEWAARARDVEVVLMGSAHLGYKWQFPHRHIPWATDLSVYRRLLHILDIGLAPVVENPWAACRSDLKILEYAMAGAVSIVSDTIPYKDWADGEFVRKGKGSLGFLRQVQDLVRNDRERKQLAGECTDHVLRERTVEANVWRWQEACDTKLREAVAA